MLKSIGLYFKSWLRNIWHFIRLRFVSNLEKDLEIIALRSQLAIYIDQTKSRKITKPRSTLAFRQLWVLISKFNPNWKSLLHTFVPNTVIGWHKRAFKIHWAKKCNKTGRPTISKEVIYLIRKIHKENPLLSPEKIHEQLSLMGLKYPPAPNTISKYLPSTRKPPTSKQIQSWKTFLKNHMEVTWATDFFTVPTIKFDILYVLIIINHGTREIVHFAITKNPNMFWVTQKFRDATPYGKTPKYLVHDNDPVFKSKVFQRFLASSNIMSKPTSFKSPWQNPYAERVVGIIRQELVNHIIPFNEQHLEKLLSKYIHNYYNTNRTHQGINCETPIKRPPYIPTDAKDIKIKATPVLNGLYHTYSRVS